MAEIGAILAVDANGNDATSPDFDGNNTTQWGFVWQWTDRLFQQGSLWGAGNALQDAGTADIPVALEAAVTPGVQHPELIVGARSVAALDQHHNLAIEITHAEDPEPVLSR